MIRKVLMLAALCALAAVSLASSASATTFVHSGSPTGPLYTGAIAAAQVGTSSLTATDGSGVTVSCPNGSFTGNVANSSGNPVTGSLSGLQFGPTCSSNTFPQITQCSRSASGTVSVSATGAGTGTLTIASITVTCKSGTTTVCTFSGSNIQGTIGAAPGGIANGEHLTFTNAGPVTSTDFGCPTSAHFNGTFGPITAGSGSTTKIFINTV